MWVVLHFANLSNVMSLWDVLQYLQWGFSIYYHERSLGCLNQRQTLDLQYLHIFVMA